MARSVKYLIYVSVGKPATTGGKGVMNAPLNVENKKQEAVELVIAELAKSLEVLEANYRQAVSNLNSLRACVETDDLTRLLRRGAFMRKLDLMLDQAKSNGHEVQLMMLDVDHFKKVNDTHGHQTGDAVLERVSSLIQNYLNNGAVAGRYGGEEIIVAMEASELEALTVAECIRNGIQTQIIQSKAVSGEAKPVRVTLSIGMASAKDAGFMADILIGNADEALYSAKNSGRNKVMQKKLARNQTRPNSPSNTVPTNSSPAILGVRLETRAHPCQKQSLSGTVAS